ncbi:MAG: porin family protein [Bacteroidota bacterium]
MKKFLLFTSTLVWFHLGVFAQQSLVYRQVSLGPRVAGVNFATQTTDPNFDKLLELSKKTQNLGFLFGGIVNIGVNKILSLQPEILFSQKGIKYIDGDDYVQKTASYLEIPLLTKFSAGNKKFSGFINLGPYLGYWVTKKTMEVVGGKVVSVGDKEDLFDDNIDDDGIADNRLDIGLSVGCGLALRVGPGNLIFDARYGLGLTALTKYKDDTYKPDPYTKASNRTIGISAGYLFELGR